MVLACMCLACESDASVCVCLCVFMCISPFQVHTDVKNFDIENNDDRILHCCLVYKMKTAGTSRQTGGGKRERERERERERGGERWREREKENE